MTTTTFTRRQCRRIARWLVAALLFPLLQPVFALGVAAAGGTGEAVQICTGAGMVWVRSADRAGPAGDATERTDVGVAGTDAGTAPAGDDAGRASAYCALCVGSMLAPADVPAGQLPPVPSLGRPAPRSSAPAVAGSCARLILDAPTRGPPRTQPSA